MQERDPAPLTRRTREAGTLIPAGLLNPQREAYLKIQSSHRHSDRGLDAYFTPIEAIHSLICIEHLRIPHSIWEPAAGDGAIVRPLRAAGYSVIASDIADYGLVGCETGVDYLSEPERPNVEGIITNPPFRLAMAFAEKALGEVPYLALLLRTNFLESTVRLSFFRKHAPARIWISSRRLPMMHRFGWQGAQAPSNTCHAWFIWDERARQKRIIDWFDWKYVSQPALFEEVEGGQSQQQAGAIRKKTA